MSISSGRSLNTLTLGKNLFSLEAEVDTEAEAYAAAGLSLIKAEHVSTLALARFS